MKLLIYAGKEKFVVSGNDKDRHTIEGCDISETVESAYNEIEAYDFLEVSTDEDPLASLLARLRKGGKLKIQGIDALKASDSLVSGQIDCRAFSEIIVSNSFRANKLNDIIRDIESKGYAIEVAGISGLHYVIEVTKK